MEKRNEEVVARRSGGRRRRKGVRRTVERNVLSRLEAEDLDKLVQLRRRGRANADARGGELEVLGARAVGGVGAATAECAIARVVEEAERLRAREGDEVRPGEARAEALLDWPQILERRREPGVGRPIALRREANARPRAAAQVVGRAEGGRALPCEPSEEAAAGGSGRTIQQSRDLEAYLDECSVGP